MAAARLSGLQRRILQVIYEAEARSEWSASPSHVEFRQALGGNKGNVSVSVRNLEAKGLIHVSRTPGGYADSVWLTREGRNLASDVVKSFD